MSLACIRMEAAQYKGTYPHNCLAICVCTGCSNMYIYVLNNVSKIGPYLCSHKTAGMFIGLDGIRA